ncbi:TetR family transcriptional regulator [Nonomuraea mesophila]|uniref:TetR family transcriptional regulator n=1 Tax=Nonomuraea mesophila TaxID=2530382 RepID=A0A4R5EB95_9ACTN|nr:TetR/AcrR family transcriptional regulator [Nonomuraea mesophila]TDE30206.1 TetR family transcriptional regulator [Nonomuraea mesophila]
MTGKQFTSVWVREPRKPASPGRSREEIVRAAVEMLDEEGLSGLSMRKLGAKLGAGATSLYWYVAHKDELLELVYDEVWSEMIAPDPGRVGWRDSVSAVAHGMRQAILRHPWSADLIGRLPALGPHAMLVADRMRKMIKAAGFTGKEVDFAISTLTAYVFGMTIPEIAWNTAMGDRYDADEMRAVVTRAAAGHPDMLERIDMDTYDDPRAIREMCFDFGLVSLLDGLERRLAT